MPQTTQRGQVDRNQFSQDDQFAQYRRNRNVSQNQLVYVKDEQPSLPYSNQPVIPNKIPQLYQNKQITGKGKMILIFFPSIAKLLQIDALSYLKQRAEYLFFPFQIQFSLNMFSTESLNLWVNVSYFLNHNKKLYFYKIIEDNYLTTIVVFIFILFCKSQTMKMMLNQNQKLI